MYCVLIHFYKDDRNTNKDGRNINSDSKNANRDNKDAIQDKMITNLNNKHAIENTMFVYF